MEQLGIEPKLLLAQIINFSIIIFVLTRLLYKPILGMLEKRKKAIEEGLALTEKMKAEEAKLKQKEEKILEEARRQAHIILEEAKKQGKAAEKDIVTEAHKESSEIIAKAHADIARAREGMEKDVRKEAVTLAAAMAKRLLANVLSEKDQHAMLADHLKELESVKG